MVYSMSLYFGPSLNHSRDGSWMRSTQADTGILVHVYADIYGTFNFGEICKILHIQYPCRFKYLEMGIFNLYIFFFT